MMILLSITKTTLSRSYMILLVVVFALTLIGSILSIDIHETKIQPMSFVSLTQTRHKYSLYLYYNTQHPFSTRNYYQSPCDANVLANCISSSSSSNDDNDILFVDLDWISFHSFMTISGNQSRLLLYYDPNSFMDHFFFAPTTTTTTTSSNSNSNSMTWFSSNETLSVMEPVIGRVNCADYPDLCSTFVKDRNSRPTLLQVSPYKGNNVLNTDTGETTLDYQEEEIEEVMNMNVTLDVLLGSFTQRMQEYGTDASKCLWKRYGATLNSMAHLTRDSGVTPLSRDCSNHLAATLYFQQQQQQQQLMENNNNNNNNGTTTTTISMSIGSTDDIITIKRLIQQGEWIVMIWNACMIVASFVLFILLNLAGYKLLKKCYCSNNNNSQHNNNSLSSSSRYYCKNVLLFQNSISLNKQQRKIQLQQQIYCFYMAAMMLGLTNMFLPIIYIIIAGPIAIVSVVWLWYNEFHCCIPTPSSFCCTTDGDSTTTSSSSSSSISAGTMKYGSVQLTQQQEERNGGGEDKKQEQVALLLLPDELHNDDNDDDDDYA